MSRWNSWSAKKSVHRLREGAPALSLFFALLAVSSASCTRSSQQAAKEIQDPQSALIARGRTAYAANCTACHNSNPARAGALGPELVGSSLELLQARILQGGYPEGYTPKRKTHQMVALPHLKAEIEALHAFLNAP